MAASYPERSELCMICGSCASRYVCPRCNALYCSVACYQSEVHVQCSEAMYRDCVAEYLSCQESTPENKNKMLEILEKNYQEEEEEEELDSDDELDSDLAERLSGVNVEDPDAVWKQLTDSEQKTFEELLRVGDVTALVPRWEPWWKGGRVKELVQEMDSTSKLETWSYEELCPTVKQVPCFTMLFKGAPSRYLKWNMLNILCAYCHMIRYFNGDPHEYAGEAAALLVTLSSNLRLAHNYESLDMATEAVVQDVLNCPCLDGSAEALDTMKTDLQHLLLGPEERNEHFYMQAALSDICQLLQEAKLTSCVGICKKSEFCKRFGEINSSNIKLIPRKQLSIYIKKIEFFLSWIKSYCNV